jgi:hypothetical protein
MDGAQLRLVIDAIRRSGLSDHVVAETNVGMFMQSLIVPLDSLARGLLGELEAYRESP